jgi:flavin-dependent thymidylate synthase
VEIILAGFNIDYETIQGIQSSSKKLENLTPETISAAYARISRNPLPVNELRKISRKEVEKARKSNETIVFDMGHSSVAEHAVFNIDVVGVSRLIVEEIEKFRLSSFTEKSQRYIHLENDFVIPEEIKNSGFETPFVETVEAQYRLYHDLYRVLKKYVFEKYSDLASDPANRSTLEGWAKEDARYVISLATEAQLGMTINARNLELMLRRSASHPLKEVKDYGNRLYDVTKHIAPSLVRYTKATPYEELTRPALRERSSELIAGYERNEFEGEKPLATDGNVTLLHATPEGDKRLLASLLHGSSNLPMERCLSYVSRMTDAEKRDLITTTFRHMESYDSPLREFETVDLTFDVILSSSCFAQMKRHRMATIISQDYDPALGVTIPPSIRDVGMEGPFSEMIEKTEVLWRRLKDAESPAAPYILTNAHRKRIALKVNARELYHISRLREDRHAQWDIRETAEAMVRLAKGVMPLTLMMAGGKDAFPSLRNEIIA